jgi:Bacteroidetes VLRF1 release factor
MAVPIGTLFSMDTNVFARSQVQIPHVSDSNQPATGLVEEALAALEIAEEAGVKAVLPTGSSGATCITCGIQSFSSPDDQRRHFKTDWHRLNVKRRIAGLDPITEDHFSNIIENDEDRDAVGSLSGSDTESNSSSSSDDENKKNEGDDNDDDTALDFKTSPAGPHFNFSFDSQKTVSYAVWRCLIAPDRERGIDPPSVSECLDSLKNLVIEGGRWAIILFRGGHFSAAIFDVKAPKATGKTSLPLLGSTNYKNDNCSGDGTTRSMDTATPHLGLYSAAAVDAAITQIAHKSFHKYVVRAKAGGKQSTKDATGKFAKSAGSRLRRHNEAALERDITQLLAVEWSQQLASCSLILVAAPGSNAKTLFSGTPALLNKKDNRIRRVPFTTRRPTLSEAKRVARVLLTVYDASEAVRREKEQRLSLLEEEKKKGKGIDGISTAENTAAAAAVVAAHREIAQREEAAARAKNAEKRAKQKQRQKQKRQAEAAERKAAEEEAAKEEVEDDITKAARQAAALAAQRAKAPAASSLTSSIPKLSSSSSSSNKASTSSMPAPARLSSKPLASEDAATRRARMAAAAEARAKALQTASSEQKLW